MMSVINYYKNLLVYIGNIILILWVVSTIGTHYNVCK